MPRCSHSLMIAALTACSSQSSRTTPVVEDARSVAVTRKDAAAAATQPPTVPADAATHGVSMITGLVELAPITGNPDDLFGHQLIDTGHELLIATPLAGDGNVTVYALVNGAWKSSGVLHRAPARGDGNFGTSIALAGDTLIVSAIEDSQAGKSAGAVYVFERSGETWKQTTKLLAGERTYQFGWRVASDGATLVVGSPYDSAGDPRGGAAFVFERNGAEWKRTAKLVAPKRGANDRFGWDVAVSRDRIAVGALADPDAMPASGAAYVFERTPDKGWALARKLDVAERAPHDAFGNDVAVIGDAVVVSAPANAGGSRGGGAIYVFERGPNGYAQTQRLVPPGSHSSDYFGDTLAAYDRYLTVGALGSHRAWLYELDAGKLVPRQTLRGERGFGATVGLGPGHVIVRQSTDGATSVHTYSITR